MIGACLSDGAATSVAAPTTAFDAAGTSSPTGSATSSSPAGAEEPAPSAGDRSRSRERRRRRSGRQYAEYSIADDIATDRYHTVVDGISWDHLIDDFGSIARGVSGEDSDCDDDDTQSLYPEYAEFDEHSASEAEFDEFDVDVPPRATVPPPADERPFDATATGTASTVAPSTACVPSAALVHRQQQRADVDRETTACWSFRDKACARGGGCAQSLHMPRLCVHCLRVVPFSTRALHPFHARLPLLYLRAPPTEEHNDGI